MKIDGIISKLQYYGLLKSLRIISQYIRGAVYRLYFDQSGLLRITGRIFVFKKFAEINIGKCIIWKGTKFDMEGESPKKHAVLKIGDFTTIGDRTEFHIRSQVIVGKHCSISWDCVIMDRNYHGIGGEPEVVKPVEIKNGAWIGCRSIILPGVTIGESAVVGAGSVVTDSVPPYTVVAGNPAKFIRKING